MKHQTHPSLTTFCLLTILAASCTPAVRPSPTLSDKTADVVIGQSDFTTNNGTPAYFNSNSIGIALSDSGVLFLSDYTGNRVYTYNTVPTTNGATPSSVLGQPNISSTSSGAAANQLSGPCGLSIYNNHLFVAEWTNNRVTIYNAIPAANQPNADIVIGQTAFGNNSAGCTSSGLHNPLNVKALTGKVLVADTGNNRVLIYNSIPTSNGAAADIVLGQSNFTTCGVNQSGALSASSLNYPVDAWTDGTRLVVGDAGNNRVLIWNTFPTSNGQPADLVLGQADFATSTANTGGISAKTLSLAGGAGDGGLTSDGTKLYVSDAGNNRVLIWNTFPTTNFAAADSVIGQADFTSAVVGLSSIGLHSPDALFIGPNSLMVGDDRNNRYLIFNF